MSQFQLQEVDWTLVIIGIVDVMVVSAMMVMIMKLLGPKG